MSARPTPTLTTDLRPTFTAVEQKPAATHQRRSRLAIVLALASGSAALVIAVLGVIALAP